jgi:ribosome-associated heat shock protein Hsp15
MPVTLGYDMDTVEEKIRLDKWLWAARFFKTRSMASQAVAGGKVHVNGQRIKPARIVHVGDVLQITRETVTFMVTVLAVSGRRGPATQARLLYEESEGSIKAREEQRDIRKMQAGPSPTGRPSKRDRRKIREFTRKN